MTSSSIFRLFGVHWSVEEIKSQSKNFQKPFPWGTRYAHGVQPRC